jgi:hypothetical protein
VHSIQTISLSLQSNQIKEKDCLKVILFFCKKHNIGYDKEGIILLFEYVPERSLSKMLDLIQNVFTKRFYISHENIITVIREIEEKELNSIVKKDLRNGLDVTKKIKNKIFHEKPIEISHLCVLQPLERCKLCTIVPCSHITNDDLSKKCEARRIELPEYTEKRDKLNEKNCLEFIQYGKCSSFNNSGHCLYNHPKSMFNIKLIPIRCAICTMIFPCDKCKYSKKRIDLMKLIKNVEERLVIINKLNSPKPPLSLTQRLDDIDIKWMDIVKYYQVVYITDEKNKIINDMKLFIDISYCSEIKRYVSKAKLLREAFDEILESKLLEPKI